MSKFIKDELVKLARPEEVIKYLDENTLMSVVMLLTCGRANPAVVRYQINDFKSEI